ncbi:hypothetical protein [Sphingobacterium chuzhouense]|uniref:Uncharacterized protein n=1 Tax=Sphingobacterium chuzhouense TaxID=1742264 RepID=A0ABR7XM28_9SPHI|nr:hypothetical protein [Sphingobacterium chuzhouense]MBD1420201.1 hypothetical protein [Sphingobacterium chuzhouense]
MKNQATFRPAYLLLMIFINIHLNSGCKKEEQWINATVLDFGNPKVDGCGFVIEIDGNIYFPVNLGEKYQTDKKEVKLQYNILEDMHACGFPQSGAKYQKASIKEIRDR